MAFNLINFKKGTLAGLNTLKSQSHIEEGTFYLTIDENKETSRLFIGTSATTALPVNSNITLVTNTSDLSSSHAANFNDGDFAYVTNGNILAVRYNGSWTQINANTEAIASLTPDVTTSNGTATISWTLKTRAGDTIYTDDQTPVLPTITMAGANGVSVSSSGDAITVSGDPATLASSAVTSNATALTLSSTGNTASGTVNISGGSNVNLSGTANNIVIGAEDMTASSLTGTAETTGFGFTSTSANGVVSTKGTIDPQITLVNEDGIAQTPIHFNNGVAALNAYTKEAVDEKFKLANAMRYRGTVGGSGATFSTINDVTNPELGDTLKVASDLSGFPIKSGNTISNTGTAKAGDLLIANGTEDANGHITAGSLYYEVVSIDEDTDTTYSVVGLEKGIALHASTDAVGTNIGSISLADGTLTTVSATGTTDKVITVNHANITTTTGAETTNPTITQADGSSQDFVVVTSLTNDGKGHITKVNTRTITVKDTNAELTSVADAVSVTGGTATAGGTATVTTTVNMASAEHGNMSQNGSFTFTSDNLKISAVDTSGIKANFVWGTF